MSDKVKYKNMSDWRSVRAAGGDAGRPPYDPALGQPMGQPQPSPADTLLPAGFTLHPDRRTKQEQRDEARSRQADALFEDLGIRGRRRA
jgi:hypothetical protein